MSVATVYERARAVLRCPGPAGKCEAATDMLQAWSAGRLAVDGDGSAEPVDQPGRPDRPALVHPRDLPQRSLHTDEGRLRLMHAIAHIEFNAINLAADAVHRFRGLPAGYYGDWIRVAADEARHFQMVCDYLEQRGCAYGDYPAHNGLWDMAEKTADDALARMALVPRVLEARGLDVTPGMIDGLRRAGDEAAAEILEVIYREEIDHVAAGSRWFGYLCRQRGLKPAEAFFELVERRFAGQLRGPFNFDAREQAGFEAEELERLKE